MTDGKNFMQRWLNRSGMMKASLVGALVAAFALGNATGIGFHHAAAVNENVGVVSTAPINAASSFAGVVKQAAPAVVSILSTKTTKVSADEGMNPLFNDPRFREFFGQGGQGGNGRNSQPRERKQQGAGSGVIISGDGYIVTNNHVIEGASDIKVAFYDKREVTAKLVGADPKSDIAVLKVNEQNLPSLKFADSSQVQVGDVALAIGNPFGIGQTVTMGIISATGRGNLGIEDYEDFIQTDAAINPGNSGGALINTNGDLIGINTAILSRAGGNQGVGFAVPANQAHQVMNQLLKGGKVVRGYMGVSIQAVTPEIAKAFNLNGTVGALVGGVTTGSPAAKAGLAAGDVITELNGARVVDSRELRLKISQMAPGTSAKLKVVRDGAPREVTITLGELPSEDLAATETPSSSETGSVSGIAVANLTPQVARQLRLSVGVTGVVVSDVAEDSAAASAGLREGDVIQQVNRRPVASVAEFNAAVQQSAGKPLVLLVNRQGRTSFVAIPAN